MISAKFKGNFSATMTERIKKWSAQKIKAAVVVPPELGWIFFQEYGVAPHPIQARNESLMVLPGPVFKQIVQWAPTEKFAQGTHSIRTVQQSLDGVTKEALAEAFAGNQDNPEAVKAAFLDAVMPKVKEALVQQIAADLPGHRAAEDPAFPRQAGKLDGLTASQVFDEKATVEESS
jgi:hypothetical protein